MGNSSSKGKATGSKGSEAWSRTKIDSQTFKYTWVIDQFPFWVNQIAKNIECSPNFLAGEHTWRLQVNTKYTHENQDYLSLYLQPFKSSKSKVVARYKLGILDGKGKCLLQSTLDGSVDHFNFETREGWGWNQFIRKDILLNKGNGYLSNDALTLFCEITLFSDPTLVSKSGAILTSHPQVILPECHLKSIKLESFLKPQDVMLVIGKQEIPAHKFALAAASPVFAAMFRHEMKEKIENRVEIKQIDPAVFEEFLHFIYTGRIKDLKKNAEDLLVVAERYGVERLKALCEESLATQLSVENILHIHGLVNLHNAKQLKIITANYFKEHSAEISKSPGFQSLVKKYRIHRSPSIVAR